MDCGGQIEMSGSQLTVKLVTNDASQALTCNVLLILMDHCDRSMLLHDLAARYRQTFAADLSITQLQNDLSGFVEVSCDGGREAVVKLHPVQMFARDARTLLLQHNGQLLLSQFEYKYLQNFHVSLSPAAYGYPNLMSLLLAVPHVVSVRGKSYHQQTVVLTARFKERLIRADTAVIPSALMTHSDADDEELATLQRRLAADILSAPVPSNLPSPALMPLTQRPPSSLIRFDSLASIQDFLMLSEDEKRGLKTPLCRTPVSDLLQFAAQFLPTALHPSMFTDSSLFGMSCLPMVTSSHVSALPCDGPVYVSTASRASVDNECTTDNIPESSEHDSVTAHATWRSSVDSLPETPTTSCNVVAINYPPMPATAQHVSEVQERILRGSSVNEDLPSPVQADTVEVGGAGETAVDPETVATVLAESTPDVFPEVGDVSWCLREKVFETPRSVTQRRSRIAARFGLVQRSEGSPDAS